MINNVALDVVIGLVFVFLLYSLLASIVQEIIATKLSFRSKILEKAILRMLEDGKTTAKMPLGDTLMGFYKLIFRSNNLKNKRFATAFYTHPLLKYLAEDNWFSKPDYITAKNFSKTMIDLLNGIDTNLTGANILRIRESITSRKLAINLMTEDKDNPANKNYIAQRHNGNNAEDINLETQLFLQSLLAESKGDIEKFRLLLENWFDDTMQRASGWYKRYTQYILVIIGFTMAYIFNVDSIAITKILAKDKKARDQMVEMAISKSEKYGNIIDSQGSRGAASPNPGNDTMLKNTFQLIQADADKATKILGLGRPWKDSCKLCKDTLDKIDLQLSGFETRKLSPTDLGFHKSESIRLDTIIGKERKDTLRKNSRDSLLRAQRIDSIQKLKTHHDTLIASQIQMTNEFQKLSSLKGRCVYIRQATSGRWNKYSPNQEGGWETFAGWLITALAISLGAPFWFDLLSKLVKIRGSGGLRKEQPETTGAGPVSNSTTPAQTINVNTNRDEEAVG